jgi:tetratricopeptide (TPR) repeat protein
MNLRTHTGASPGPALRFCRVVFLLICLSAFGWTDPVIAKAPPPKRADTDRTKGDAAHKPKTEPIDPRAFDLYVNAILMENTGDLLAASQLYERALDYFPQSYEIRYSLAASLYSLRHPNEALQALRQLSSLDGKAYALAAACYRAIGDLDQAAASYLRQTMLDSTAVPAYSFLAGYYRSKAKIDSAAWAYHNLARLVEDNVQLLNDLGRLEAQRGNLDSALSAFGHSAQIRNDTTNAAAVISLSETYEMKEQLDSATAVLERAVHVAPTYIPYRQSLINLYARMDSVALALPHALVIAQASPNDSFSARRLGILYFNLDSLDRADSIFSARIKVGEEDPLNYYYLGRIASLRKDWKRAVDRFGDMTKVADTSSTAWISLASAQRQNGDTVQSIATLRRATTAVKSEKAALDVYFALGATYEQNNQVDSSVAVFEELLKHAPNFAQALNYLGYTLADRNIRLDYAKQLVAHALELEPKNGAYLDSYGWVLYRQKQFQEALGYLQQAAELQPDPTVFEHLGDVYRELQNPVKAREWWEKALKILPENKQLIEKLKK